MKTTAAILVETGKPLEHVDLDVPALKPGQVLVEVGITGVCHTQILEARGHRGEDRFLPHCLGHEGAGRIVDVAEGVTRVSVGDIAVMSWLAAGGAQVPGTKYGSSIGDVNAGFVTTFQQYAVCSENRVTRVESGLTAIELAMMGCAVPTGFGSVFNTLQARPGQSLAVFGVGGVGMCALIAAASSSCRPLIAIDVEQWKLDKAVENGATHTINAANEDVVSRINEIIPSGLDLSVEASGRPSVMSDALSAVRPRGGKSVLIGNAHHGETVDLVPLQFNMGKQLLGSWGGETEPDRDFIRYKRVLEQESVNISQLSTSGYTLETINQAMDDLEGGKALRPMVAVNMEIFDQ